MKSHRFPTAAVAAAIATAAIVAAVAWQPFGDDANETPPSGLKGELLVAIDVPATPAPNRYGVPVGWPHTSDGAEDAAVSFVRATAIVAKAGPLERRDVLTSMATASYASGLIGTAGRELDELLFSLGERGVAPEELVWAEYPLTASRTSSDDDQVEVEVWSVLVVGATNGSVARQVWRTSTIAMHWEADDWKVDAWTSAPGPFPTATSEAEISSAAEVAAVIAWPSVGVGS